MTSTPPPPHPEPGPPSPEPVLPAQDPAPSGPWGAPPPPPEGWAPQAALTPALAPRPPWVTRREVRAGLLVVAALVVVGVLAGLVWLWWSPARGIALALGPHTLLPDETENFVAADGRYAVITAVVGLLAGLGAYAWRSVRGPVLAVFLALGAGAGAALTALVGRLFGGGAEGAATQQIVTPPLALQAVGLIAVEAVVALLVYGVSVTISARDDLGVDGEAGEDDEVDDARDPFRGPGRVDPAAPPLT